MPDFTAKKYRIFLNSLLTGDYKFQTFSGFLKHSIARSIILRHDIDARKENALHCAQIEHDLGICATYYFRIIPKSFDTDIIRQIADLGHEIGYHYESLAKCRGNFERAIKDFKKNLERFRNIVPVKTICMHGSPLSKWDSRKLWEKYDYRNFEIIGEPYFDIDFTQVLYLTDTGRRWNGEKYSVRDKVWGVRQGAWSEKTGRRRDGETKRRGDNVNTVLLSDRYNFHSTFDIIMAAERGKLPDKIIINIHPQRWNNEPIPWLKEYIFQNVKNVIKKFFIVK